MTQENKKVTTQWRNTQSKKLALDLIDLGIVKRSEKVSAELLVKACIRAEERTRPTKSQKKNYKGVLFRFDSHLDMAIYFIKEKPLEWENCKLLSLERKKAKGKKAKRLVTASIDRIYTDGYGRHYERDNIRIVSYKENRDIANEDKKIPYKYLRITKDGVQKEYYESETKAQKALGKDFKYAIEDIEQKLFKQNKKFHDKFVANSSIEEINAKLGRHRPRYLEDNGLSDLVK